MLRIEVSGFSKHLLMLVDFFAAEAMHIWQKWQHLRAFEVQKITKNSKTESFFKILIFIFISE